MALIKMISEDHIEDLEKQEHENLHKMLDSQAEAREKSWEAKERWLSIFARSLSPTVACKQADVPVGTYRRWRATDPRFCRALNTILAEAHDELIGTAYARATGYFQADPSTDSGYQEDATGRPIRHGVSDRLAISLVNANEKAREASSPVVINVNFAALGIPDPPDKLEHKAQDALEGECQPVDTDRVPDE